jgi:hypothetical protein
MSKAPGRWKSQKTAGHKTVAAAEDGYAPDFENTPQGFFDARYSRRGARMAGKTAELK